MSEMVRAARCRRDDRGDAQLPLKLYGISNGAGALPKNAARRHLADLYAGTDGHLPVIADLEISSKRLKTS